MTSKYFYSKGWFTRRKKNTSILLESEALDRHKTEELYTVLVGSDAHPTHFLNITKDYIGVFFLDDELRDYLYYQFQRSTKYPEKLFLSWSKKREFIGDSFDVKHNLMCFFYEDGRVKVEDRTPLHDENKTVSVESYETFIDLSDTNYADFPEFGEYEEFLKIR